MKMNTASHTILHLIETKGPGGAEKVFIALAEGMNRGRFRSIACLRAPGWLHDQLEQRGVSTFLFSDKGMFDPGFVRNLMKICKNENVTVIHSHEFLMNFYGALVGFLNRIPVVTTVHGRYYYWEKARRRMAMRFAAKHSQMVTVSQELTGFLVDKVGIPGDGLKTIYNGIDLEKYSQNDTTDSRLTIPDLNEQAQVVGTVGNLYPVKGQTYLLQSIPLILKKCPDTMFVFAGRGELEETLKKEAAELGVEAHVRFLGFVADVPALLNKLDVFTLPSLAECFPLSVLEAMAHGVPPVVTDVGGNREIIEDGVSGYVVPAADHEALAEKIICLLQDKELVRSIGEHACGTIQARFSMETMLSNYAQLYDKLIGKGRVG